MRLLEPDAQIDVRPLPGPSMAELRSPIERNSARAQIGVLTDEPIGWRSPWPSILFATL